MSETIREMLARLDERTETMAEDIDQVKHVLLEGNGSPALTVQVAIIDSRLKSIEGSHKDSKIPKHVTIGLIVSVMLSISGMLVGFVY